MDPDTAAPPTVRTNNCPKKHTSKARLQNLLAQSSIHGLSRLHQSQSRGRRTIWWLTILIILVLVGYHLSILINDFMAHETDVDVKRAETRTLEFPAVTVCNANPVKKSALERLAPYNHLLRELLDLEVYGRTEPGLTLDSWISYESSERRQFYLSTMSSRYHQAEINCRRMGATLVNITTINMALDFRHAIGADFYLNIDSLQTDGVAEGRETPNFQKAESVTRILANLPEDEKMSIGHQVNDLIFYCRYNGRKCNVSAVFQHFSNPFLGNCYTFNADMRSLPATKLLAPMSGRRHALELGINIEQDDILRAAGGVPGAVFLIHSKHSTPFPEDRGIVLKPGLYNGIGMRVVEMYRLSYPYGECLTLDIDATERDAYISEPDASYSRLGCMKTCYQRYMIEICRCALPYYPRYGKPFGGRNVPLCHADNAKQQLCQKQVDLALAQNQLDCDCPDPCHEVVYVSHQSAVRWPMMKRMESTVADLKMSFPKQFGVTSDESSRDADRKVLTSNFLKAAIFYEDIHHEIISETPAYTVFQFVGDVGGMMALWIGLSALGVIQIIEFVLMEIFFKANHVFSAKVQDTVPDKVML
ncbi:hypothetical protein LSH36_579g05092 [Paralvinella palmiformis]|uniref:Amiloride-sensitive sodium channel n=1 Tax=Paralvinella palmiformis TaxID=53620 RepID=A0AAD9MVG2_9ANNE|nr:hypothetical protein LSH36_579g05092 [Paralvinella palmiformis]